MQAVILSGGEGKRLRPLTATMPKPAVPLVNQPLISHQLEWLARHGITDVILSCGFLADGLRDTLGDGSRYGVSIMYIEESEPLGTAGAVKFAEQYLDDRFMVFNGDTIADFDLSAEIAQHEQRGARATIALVPVDDASHYGVVLTAADNAVTAFLEKPQGEDIPPNPRINAGAYVLERDVLELVPAGEMWSFEHGVFPRLIDDGLFAFDGAGYWLDVGTPDRFIEATRDILDGSIVSRVGERLAAADGVLSDSTVSVQALRPPVVIAAGCEIDDAAVIGPRSVLGEGCKVQAGATIDGAVLLDGCEVGEHASVTDSIIGRNVQIGAGATVATGSVVGEGAVIGSGVELEPDSRIEPNSQLAPV